MSSWIDLPEERRRLAETLHARHCKARSKRLAHDAAAEETAVDDVWREACEKGHADGKVRLCWMDLQRISDRVYSFSSTAGRELRQLALDGIGLPTVEESLFRHCADLTHLSLASNRISDITGIHGLVKLQHLNLLRNDLRSLPDGIGQLSDLTRLDVANNRLVRLPEEIGRLRRLRHLNLECNELSELPVDFGRLACDVINVNCNNLRVFPSCFLDMPRLRELSIMANDVDSLPGDMGRMRQLQAFRASRNRIRILPDSVVRIPSLECLWLDHNNLAALPPNFHCLGKLRVLKLEGNPDMIHPAAEIILAGVEAVLRWSRGRVETKKVDRVRCVVQSLEECLALVERHRIGGDRHEALFRVEDDCYQFPPDALWSVFIPELRKMWSDPDKASSDGIKSFPFARDEAEQALFAFRDAAGPIVRRAPAARFRRCACVPRCVPPVIGYMCQRPAVAVRRRIAYEEDMIERRRAREEERRVAEAAGAARAVARAFLESEDGMVMAREEAEKRLAARERRPKDDVKASSMMSGSTRTIAAIRDMGSHFGRNRQSVLLKRIEDEVKAEYIDTQVAQKKQEAMERNKKVVEVMKRWLGVTTEEVFWGWRNRVEASKKRERKERRKKMREERLQYEDNMAAYELKKTEHSGWVQQWDGWNDVAVWVHRDSGETLLERPVPPPMPLAPPSLMDIITGKSLSPRAIRRIEADTSEDESWTSTDDDSVRTDRSHAKCAKDLGGIDDDESAPPGRNTEYKLAAKRVLERRGHAAGLSS